jgi:hypothetical protein
MKVARKLERRRGFASIIIGGAVAAALYYGAVFLLLEGVRAMPDTPPQAEEARAENQTP